MYQLLNLIPQRSILSTKRSIQAFNIFNLCFKLLLKCGVGLYKINVDLLKVNGAMLYIGICQDYFGDLLDNNIATSRQLGMLYTLLATIQISFPDGFLCYKLDSLYLELGDERIIPNTIMIRTDR